jgi:hypothetical protein
LDGSYYCTAAPFAISDRKWKIPIEIRLKSRCQVNILNRLPGENMQKRGTNKRTGAKAIPKARLDELIEEAIVDCYNESEQVSGFFCMLEDQLAVPFTTKLLGEEIIVEKIDITEEDQIVAICRRGRNRQRISILDLPLPSPGLAGAEWIEAYRHWARWR